MKRTNKKLIRKPWPHEHTVEALRALAERLREELSAVNRAIEVIGNLE